MFEDLKKLGKQALGKVASKIQEIDVDAIRDGFENLKDRVEDAVYSSPTATKIVGKVIAGIDQFIDKTDEIDGQIEDAVFRAADYVDEAIEEAKKAEKHSDKKVPVTPEEQASQTVFNDFASANQEKSEETVIIRTL